MTWEAEAPKWLAGIASLIATVFGITRWRASKAKALEEKIDARVAKDDYERHQKANAEQVKKHHDAILDLYSKRDEVLEIIRQHDKDDRDRHDQLMQTISGMHVSLLERLGKK